MSSRFEVRTALISTLLLSLSILLDQRMALPILILTVAFNFKVLKALAKLTPLIALYVASSLFLGGIDKILTMVSLLSLFLFLYDLNPEEVGFALMYFRFPPRFAYSICISLRLLQNVSNDLNNLLQLKKLERFGYLELLKRLTNVAVIRAVSMAESLKSRSFDLDMRITHVNKPSLKDYALLLSSITLALLSLL
ncbi:hypothetical protein [Archaeoglobus sp.]